MALWGGRYQFKEHSVSHEDFGEPGEGLRDPVPDYPPGVFVGKFGERRDESCTQADFKAKERIATTFFAGGINFKMPQPLKREWWEDKRFPTDDLQPLYRASTKHYDETARQVDKHSGEYTGLDSRPQWPAPDPPEWKMPGPRRPYFHFNTLRTDGQFPRLTSTYTEDLGQVTAAEPQQVVLPPPGLLPWGVTQRETEYLKKFSAEILRHPQFNPPQRPGLAHARSTPTPLPPPRWETTYEAACNQVANAPSWIKQFLSHPPYPKALR